MMLPPIPSRSRKSLDRHGVGDPAVPSRFGHLPTEEAPSPFSTREHARLLVLRGRIRAGLVGADDVGCIDAPAAQGWADGIVVGAPVLAGSVLALLGHLILTASLPGL